MLEPKIKSNTYDELPLPIWPTGALMFETLPANKPDTPELIPVLEVAVDVTDGEPINETDVPPADDEDVVVAGWVMPASRSSSQSCNGSWIRTRDEILTDRFGGNPTVWLPV